MAEFNKQASMNQFATHLRFVGYDVRVEDEVLIANHPSKPTVLVLVYSNGAILRSFFTHNSEASRNPLGFLELINGLNQKALVTRYYADKDSDLAYESFYASEYSQTNFARFLELWDIDFQSMMENSQLLNFLK